MKPKTTTTEPRRNVWELPTVEDELRLCETVRFICLRAMDTSNGESSALRDIRTGCYTDKLWKNSEARNSRAVELHTIADTEREQANKARQTLKRIRISDEDRQTAQEALEYWSTLADNDRAEAEDTEKANNALTATLAEDMLIAIWIDLQSIKANPDRQTEKAFGELCKTGREFINGLSSVSIIDSMATISRPLTVAEAVYYMTRYNADPKARPRHKWGQTAKGCTGHYTLEPKERKKDLDPRKVDPATIANYARFNDACIWYYEHMTLPTIASASASFTIGKDGEAVKTIAPYTTAFPALDAKSIATRYWYRQTQAEKTACLGLDPTENPVLYLVLHVPTIRTEYSAEDMTDHDPRTAEAVADAVLASVDVVALADLANLGQQARTAVEALTHPEAIKQARTAYNVAMEEGKRSLDELQTRRALEGKKKYNPGKIRQLTKQYTDHANNVYKQTLWDYALTVAQYKNKPEAKRTIIEKLTKAYHNAPDKLTPGNVDFVALMQSTRRGCPDRTPAKLRNPYTIITAHYITDNTGKKAVIWTAAHPAQHRPIIRFTDSGTAPEVINPGIDYRAEAIQTADSYRAIAPKAEPPKKSGLELKQWEKLCRTDAETAELWKAFCTITEALDSPKADKDTEPKPTIFDILTERKNAPKAQPKPKTEPTKDKTEAPKPNPAQLAKVAPGAIVVTKYGTGKIAEVNGEVITVRISRTNKHRFNAPLAIAHEIIEIL